jgi:pantoate--beta-alanine ligase
MLLFKKVSDLQQYLSSVKKKGGNIGFVPTMGALHKGHTSLVGISKQENTCTVVSIFVNPTQFNDKKDLEKYPRPIEKDIELLSLVHCDVLFLPSVDEIYPVGLDTKVNVDIGDLDKVLEGKFRPGHFDGMMQVVNRLINIVNPQNLYMGQKDFQQFTIVRHMLQKLESKVLLSVCPTLREADGLAMSSRNIRLSEENRSLAPLLFSCLCYVLDTIESTKIETLKNEAAKRLIDAGTKLEYFDIVDGSTLKPITVYDKSKEVVALVATWLGDVRLIDNIIINTPKK